MSATNEKTRQDDIMRKIKFLLRKAQSTTPGEMEACMAKAQELANKYQLDLSTIDPNSEEFEVNETSFMDVVRITNECKYASIIIEKYFNVSVYYRRSYSTTKHCFQHSVRVVGTDTDQALAKFIFDFLVRSFRDFWNTALKAGRYHINDRHVFMKGLFHGVMARLMKEKQDQCQERALMVISNKLVQRDSYLKKHVPDLKEGKAEHVNQGTREAYQDGYNKGQALQLRKGVTKPEAIKKGELA